MHHRMMVDDRGGSHEYGTTSANANVGGTLVRFGTPTGDVSLTLGLRHAGNLPEKSRFSVTDFGAI